MINVTVSLGDIIAILALVLSAYATWRAHTFKKREEELMEIQKKLNTLMLDKEKREAAHEKEADLSANFVTIGSKKYRLRIFNKGRAAAYHVTIDFPEGNDIILEDDIQEKFPLELLERGQSVDLIAMIAMGTKRKLAIRLSWESADGERCEKTVYVTV
jgi:hypothetical protein